MLSHPMTDIRDLQFAWRSALAVLQLELNEQIWRTWLEGTRALRLESGVLVVEARSTFGCDWLNERLLPPVERIVAQVFRTPLSVTFVSPGLEGDAPSEQPVRPSGPPACVVGTLRAEFTFDRYIPAAGNLPAISAARALVDGASPAMTPLVAWGPPGMGKTHLLHALAACALQSGWPVACITAERFTRAFMDTIGRAPDATLDQVRTARLLILDDLHDLEGKTKTAIEFSHALDAVTNGGGVVAVASERDPRTLALPDRLQSRLRQGFITQLGPLCASERREFIERQAALNRAALPSWSVERLASAEFSSVRDLAGVVNWAIQGSRHGYLDPARLDTEIVRHGTLAGARESVSLSALLDRVAAHFELKGVDLAGRERTRTIETARAAAVAVLRDHGHGAAAIGRALGNRDGSTISGLTKRGRTIVEADPALRQLLAS
ncbi:MAG: DnaA ATPase domain-containing protein [Tepidiformaceae bacterium]